MQNIMDKKPSLKAITSNIQEKASSIQKKASKQQQNSKQETASSLRKDIEQQKSASQPRKTEQAKSSSSLRQRREQQKRLELLKQWGPRFGIVAAAAIVAVCLVSHFSGSGNGSSLLANKTDNDLVVEGSVTDEASASGAGMTDDEVISFEPHCTENTEPSNLITTTSIMVNDEVVTDYTASDTISFDKGSDYTDVAGVVTFRGNNFRNNPTYGTATLEENKLNGVWTNQVGSLTFNGETWSGTGWTGQPLLMQWPSEVKQHMNMTEEAKEKDDLVEVIYATMDGYIYFYDLETGEATRDPMYLGFTCKGAGALDPRGYPILYVGAGIDSNEGYGRVFIINLLDCSIMTTFGNEDSFRLRDINYFDSSPLVDAETDTLIYPGENGILYLAHLNTNYDADAGTLSVDPEFIKWNYQGTRSSSASYWLGMEDSAAAYDGYLFVADNGGNLMCLNLNTLELVWVQDTLDDTNDSPVLSVEDGKLYLYMSTSFRYGWRGYDTALIPVWKIDAETGEIVWQHDYECHTQDGVSGGVQSTIALGKNSLSDYIYVTVAGIGDAYSGVLDCIDKNTGELVWEHEAYYAWSSPVCVYDEEGNGDIIYSTCAGKMYLLDGLTGETYDTLEISDGSVESSPAVFDSMLCMGTRSGKIWGIELQ